MPDSCTLKVNYSEINNIASTCKTISEEFSNLNSWSDGGSSYSQALGVRAAQSALDDFVKCWESNRNRLVKSSTSAKELADKIYNKFIETDENSIQHSSPIETTVCDTGYSNTFD